MSKTLTSFVVVIVLLVGGYFIFTSKKSDDNKLPAESKNDNQATSKKMAFSEFLKQGGSYKCEVNQFVENTETKGTTYISDGMIRGEYSIKIEDRNMDSTVIIRDGFTYSWSSMLPGMGFKLKNDANSSVAGNNAGINDYAEQIGDYNCEAWTVDPSKFAIPTDIKFQELMPK
jgi:hypothetical protein